MTYLVFQDLRCFMQVSVTNISDHYGMYIHTTVHIYILELTDHYGMHIYSAHVCLWPPALALCSASLSHCAVSHPCLTACQTLPHWCSVCRPCWAVMGFVGV